MLHPKTICRVVLGVVLMLIVFSEPASGACAWVLWWENTMSSFSYRTADVNVQGRTSGERESYSTTWNILGSYTTNDACGSQQKWKIESMLKSWRKDKAEATFGEHTIDYEAGSNIISKRNHYVGENTSTHSQMIRYLCLPDNVDPRERK